MYHHFSVSRQLILLVVSILFSVQSFSQTTLAAWNVQGVTNHGPANFPATSYDNGLIQPLLVKGPGITTSLPVFPNSTGGWGGSGGEYANAAQARVGGSYFTCTFEGHPGYTISIDSIKPFHYRRNSNAVNNILVEYKIGNGNYQFADTVFFTGQLNSGWFLRNINLTSFNDLQDIPSGVPVTFRFVLWGATPSNGLFYIYNFGNSPAPDLAFSGKVELKTQATDHFRSVGSGNWANVLVWESSPDSSLWITATDYPGAEAKSVSIGIGNMIEIDSAASSNNIFVESGANLIIRAGDTLTVVDRQGPDLRVDGTLEIEQGAALVMLSDSSGTASIGPSSGSILGEVTIERYIPAKRSWRFITAPVSSTTTLYENWQEGGQVNLSGYGMHIMGPLGSTNGIDAGANNYSVFTYQVALGSNSWTPVVSTNQPADVFTVGTGYRAFIRGDRTIPVAVSNTSYNATTLRAKGSVLTGDVVFAGGNAVASHPFLPALDSDTGGFTLVGNPYASPVDILSVFDNNAPGASTSGLNPNFYWAWDAQTNGINNRGRYVVYDVDLEQNNGGTSEVSRHIQSGQAFFVQTTSADPTLSFRESNKSVTSTSIFKTTSVLPRLDITLTIDDTITADAALVKYRSSYLEAVGFEDAFKLSNSDENLSIFRESRNLSIEARPDAFVTDTIYLNVWQMDPIHSYQLKVEALEFPATWLLYLRDAYLNQLLPIGQNINYSYNFNVLQNQPGSYGSERFSLIISQTPLTASNIHLAAVTNPEGVLLNWGYEGTGNVTGYQLERSEGGVHFIELMETEDPFSNTWIDRNPLDGESFYRLRVQMKDGAKAYSRIVNYTRKGGGDDPVTIYPNPIIDGKLLLNTSSLAGEVWTFTILDAGGREIMSLPAINPERPRHTIQLPMLASGQYLLIISSGSRNYRYKFTVQ